MKLPPLSALEALEALARLGSVSAAAQDLGLTQSAVSHKLRALEDRLGFGLTVPAGRGVVLTGAARQYLDRVTPALVQLRAAHAGVSAAEGKLTVACASGFAATWLAPRLRSFCERFPAVDLTLRTTAAAGDGDVADVSIVFRADAPSRSRHLLSVTFFPVCSPSLLRRGAPPTHRDLEPAQLLHLGDRADWSAWLDHPVSGGIVFSDMLTMLAAAEAGQGICLGDSLTCDEALSSGRLVRPYAREVPMPQSYWVTQGPGDQAGAADAFMGWLEDTLGTR